TLVSITAVGAFDAVGSILVVALMIAPPATAYLLTDKLSSMLIISAAIGVANAIVGYWVAHLLDASIAGSMATIAGLIFTSAFLFAPDRGMVAIARRRIRQKWEFAQSMLLIHLFNHEGLPEAKTECRKDHLQEHLRWEQDFADQVVKRAEKRGMLNCVDGFMELTEVGRSTAKQAIVK
ncbi:MAG: metal ABC transporter permease, partial [candidate division Zixibacteria bacterium]|nr:metal ABC transporter permease [candidate division Zixibacteria bacterium]